VFGYLRYDLPNLFVKDFMLYRAMYCGLCKGIGETCGQKARLALSYDLTFASAILHNIKGEDVEIQPSHCFEHVIGKKPIAKVDDLTRALAALDVILVYYKLTDDIMDGDGGRVKRQWFKKGYKRAKKKYPVLDEIVRRNMESQSQIEKSGTDSIDRAADPTATLMREISDELLGEKKTEATGELFYGIGKWVYLIDAVDDYDKDKKKGAYNPFEKAYGSKDRASLISEQGEEIGFLFNTLFYSLRENLGKIQFSFNRDLTDNIVMRGIPAETSRILKGEKRGKPDLKVK